jgi:hypothetical protein
MFNPDYPDLWLQIAHEHIAELHQHSVVDVCAPNDHIQLGAPRFVALVIAASVGALLILNLI